MPSPIGNSVLRASCAVKRETLGDPPHGGAEVLDDVVVAQGGLGKDSESLSLVILHPCADYSFV